MADCGQLRTEIQRNMFSNTSLDLNQGVIIVKL